MFVLPLLLASPRLPSLHWRRQHYRAVVLPRSWLVSHVALGGGGGRVGAKLAHLPRLGCEGNRVGIGVGEGGGRGGGVEGN